MNWLVARWYSQRRPLCWLLPLEKLYLILSARHRRKSLAKQWQAPVPVIVVGNISVGGTGKTPLVLYLCQQLQQMGLRPGIISRGYQSQAKHFPLIVSPETDPAVAGDEPSLLARRSGCPLVIDPDRVSAARCLLEHFECDLLISDDGMQHYALGRDIEIAVLDGQRGLGNGHCLPAGPLREPPDRLAEVDLLVCNGRAEVASPELEAACQMQLQPAAIRSLDGKHKLELDAFRGKQVHALAGIGNPQRFFDTVSQQLGAEVICHSFPDHHGFQAEELNFSDGLPLLMTEKDAVKAAALTPDNAWYLEVSAVLPDNFMNRLQVQLTTILKKKGIHING